MADSNLFKRGAIWYVRFRHDGREVRKSAGRSKKAAQILLATLMKDAERADVGLPKRSKETLESYRDNYMGWAEQHKRSWRRDERSLDKALLPALGHFKLRELTRARVEAYMRTRRNTVSKKTGDKISAATVNREVACLRRLLNYAVEQGELDANPIAGIKLFAESPGRIPTLSATDEQALLDACQPWMRLTVRLAILTGARQGALLALRWRHIDFDNRAIIIVDSKTGESRRVPMHAEVVNLLKPVRGLPDGFVIDMPACRVFKKGTGMVTVAGSPEPHTVTQAFTRACARAIERAKKSKRPPPALDGMRFHDLRHVCGTRLLATGATLPEVQTMLGHKTLHMARRYAHTSWDRLSNLVDMMPAATIGEDNP